MESPPPVPPKDLPNYATSMNGSRPPSAPASGSKRKREAQDDTVYNERNGRLEVADQHSQGTPKRSRSSHAGVSDGDISTDTTPMAQRGLRRKKGSRNLSNLNLRHEASLQALPQRQTSPSRESKFQEGSLSDKPSDKPPSMYTRFTRTDSGNLMMVDALMSDYHNGMPTPKESMEQTIQYEKDTRDERVAEITARQQKDESAGTFKFGKSFSSGFNWNPVSLWNRMWGEQREELIRQNKMEAERKARLKAAAEAKYAQMKHAGQLPMQEITFGQPHDSAIALDSSAQQSEQYRDASFSSALRPSHDEADGRDGSEVPESASRPLRTFKSRLHLRRPSLRNLKDGIKRTKSEFNLGAVVRESSSSASPTKTEFEPSTLRRSVSKYDLKKQHKLTKRVSDLETKLQKARSDLDQALVEASPAPKLNGKHQRFTPNSTIRKPKFVPGALPTLPSGQVLFPEELGFRGDEEHIARFASETRPRRAFDLTEAFDDIDGEDVIRETRPKPRTRVVETFEGRKSNEVNQVQDLSKIEQGNINHSHDHTINLNDPTTELTDLADMGPTGISSPLDEDTTEPSKTVTNKALDEKLRALDANVKLSKKPAKSKKRMSVHVDEKTFKPDGASDDDAEWEQAAQKPKKKRKSAGKSELTTRTTRTNNGVGKQKSPEGKKSSVSKASPKYQKFGIPVATSPSREKLVVAAATIADGSEDELAKIASTRASVASEDKILEPVFEEVEDIATVSTAHPSSISAEATTAARFGRHAVRSRSSSPRKRSEPVTSEERMMSRAAVAAQRKRPSRSASPPPVNDHSKTAHIADEVVTVVPGEDGVPKLPSGANGSFESLADAADVEILKDGDGLTTKASFEWPADVF